MSPERGHVVDIESPSLMLHPKEMIPIKWSPEDIVPSFLTESISSFRFDIVLYRQLYTRRKRGRRVRWQVSWNEEYMLAQNVSATVGETMVFIPNSTLECTLPLEKSGSIEVRLCPVAIKVSVSEHGKKQDSSFALPASVGVWSGVAFLDTSSLVEIEELHAICKKWGQKEEMSGVTGKRLLQDVVPCPPNEFLARIDPDYEEEILTSLFRRTGFSHQAMAFLHPGISSCYRQAM